MFFGLYTKLLNIKTACGSTAFSFANALKGPWFSRLFVQNVRMSNEPF